MIIYVNVYKVEHLYGGPEEGGWYYNAGTPIASVPVLVDTLKMDEATKLHPQIVDCIASLKNTFKDIPWGDINSVNGGVELGIYVAEEFAEYWPKEKPVYC